MIGNEYLADTNAVLYLLKGDSCMRPYLSAKLAISVITEMELLSFADITESEENNIRSLLLKCRRVFISLREV